MWKKAINHVEFFSPTAEKSVRKKSYQQITHIDERKELYLSSLNEGSEMRRNNFKSTNKPSKTSCSVLYTRLAQNV